MKLNHFKSAGVLVAAALAVSACASAPTYGPANARGYGGYSEQRIDGDRFRVTFSGRSFTSREAVEMGLLLRSAELTVQNGYDWFSTNNRATERESRYYRDYDPFYRDRYWPHWGPSWRFHRRGYWSAWDPFWGPGFATERVDRFEASQEIILRRGQKPEGDASAFDAREVIANLGPRFGRS